MRILALFAALSLFGCCLNHQVDHGFEFFHGAIVRGDTTERSISLVFTGDEFADGGEQIISVLKRQQVKGSFFLTGKFYRNPNFELLIQSLINQNLQFLMPPNRFGSEFQRMIH